MLFGQPEYGGIGGVMKYGGLGGSLPTKSSALLGQKQSPYAGALSTMYMTPAERARWQEQYSQQQQERNAVRPMATAHPQEVQKQWWAQERGRRAAALAEGEMASAASSGRQRAMVPQVPPATGVGTVGATTPDGMKSQLENLQLQLGISRAQSDINAQPLISGIQREILGKIGRNVGVPSSSVPFSNSIYGGRSLGWANSGSVPQFPQSSMFGGAMGRYY